MTFKTDSRGVVDTILVDDNQRAAIDRAVARADAKRVDAHAAAQSIHEAAIYRNNPVGNMDVRYI